MPTLSAMRTIYRIAIITINIIAIITINTLAMITINRKAIITINRLATITIINVRRALLGWGPRDACTFEGHYQYSQQQK